MKTQIIILLLIYFVQDSKNECVKTRSVNIHVPVKETSKVVLECRGDSYFRHFSYVYWIIGKNKTVDQLPPNSGYRERIYLFKKPHRCENRPRADLILTNITDEMRNEKLTCVLIDPKDPLKESVILSKIWNCVYKI
ncbi:14L protein [Yaba-like disease virus]|uniref:14L protein n=1 Tax=Yaba-like disease virus TaxID=132475 RepID=Q9DHU8_YLDV|nr:14L protein [Yaba-like disease virus]CAC21252.1 14L protein [Yaba-like disease virus]